MSEEINDYMIDYKPENEDNKNHVEIHQSNFFWGFPEVKEDEFDKEKKIIEMGLGNEKI